MKKTEKLQLINGNFTAKDAKEVLVSVFLKKILFHEMKNFSSMERFKRQDKVSLKKIPELKKSLEKIIKICAEAETKNQILSVSSVIDINFTGYNE